MAHESVASRARALRLFRELHKLLLSLQYSLIHEIGNPNEFRLSCCRKPIHGNEPYAPDYESKYLHKP
jgi:hypothetical protein